MEINLNIKVAYGRLMKHFRIPGQLLSVSQQAMSIVLLLNLQS